MSQRIALALLLVAAAARADSGAPEESHVKQRHARSMKAQQAACDGGDAEACDKLGQRYVDSFFAYDGGDHDDGTRAMALYQRACDLGLPKGCTDVAWTLMEGMVGRDYGRAEQILKKTCAGGDASGCSLLADLYYYEANGENGGPNPRLDKKKAIRLYEQVCAGKVDDLGCMSGCDELASISWYGSDGQPRDVAKAVRFYDRACTAGCTNSCDSLGRIYREGDGVAKDLAHAAQLYQRACDLRFSPSCKDLALLAWRGDGVARDPARAKKLMERACRISRGHVEECKSDATGRTAIRDLERATK
jgi:TPR repeat protein